MAKVNLFNQVRDFVEKINEAGSKPLYELTPEEARGVLARRAGGENRGTRC